jgi:hypothetical protein
MKIEIKNQEPAENGWQFEVQVSEGQDCLEYSVTLDKDYWQKLADGKQKPAELVKRSFEFLLEREPKESILKSFNLRLISQYFPEYETWIKAVD